MRYGVWGAFSPPTVGSGAQLLCDLRKHGVRLRDILAQQGVGLRIQCGGMGFVGHQLCVDEHVQAGGLQGGLAQCGGAACIGHGQRAAPGSVFFHKCNAFGALAHDLQRHGTGSIQCGFQHSGLVSRLLRSVLGQAIGGGQRRKGFGIRLHQCFQLHAQGTGPLVQGQKVRFHGGILLFAHRDSRGRNVAYEHTEFTSGKEIKQAAGNAGIGLTYANETPFFHFADYRTAASNDLPGAPAAKTISITHSESYRTRLTYNSWGRSYKLEMYNRSKKAYENTVDELTGKQLAFDNVVVCFADIAAYAGDSHDVQSVNYVAGGQAFLFTRGGVQVGHWEKPHPTHPLKLYIETGEEMTLNRGKTYLALVDNDEWSNFSY